MKEKYVNNAYRNSTSQYKCFGENATQYLSLLPVPDKIIYAGTHFRVGNNHLSFWNRANMSVSPIYCQHFANIPIAKPKKQEHGGKG